MRRSNKPRKIGFWPWVIGVVLVCGGLVALFSITSTERMARDWPLGIDLREVRSYAAVLDRRPVEVGNTKAELFRFGGSKQVGECLDEQSGGKWRTRWFETDGYGDSVEVRNLRGRAGYLVRFKKNSPLGDQRRILLLPANVLDIRAEYLETIAAHLGLLTPSIGYVRLIGCGKELGVFRKMERVDGDLIERRGLRNASLVEVGTDPERPDAQFTHVRGDSAECAFLRGIVERALLEAKVGNTGPLADLVDEEAAIAWLLMAWIDQRDMRKPIKFAHQWVSGRMVPIYEVAPAQRTSWNGPIAFNPITPLLGRPEFRARFDARAAELQKEIPALRERFETGRMAWLPVLSDERTMPYAQTSATRQSEDILYRISSGTKASDLERELIFGPGYASFLSGMPMPAPHPVEQQDPLDELMKRYELVAQDDTIFFPRGKYTIDQSMDFPASKRVVLLEGARLFMGADANIRCFGELHIRGTLRNPVFIRPQNEDAPFGTIAVLGSGAQQCDIRGLYISGGSGALLDGIRHSAMISVQGMGRTRVLNSVFEDHEADAALAIHGGHVELEGVRCKEARHAMVQLSYTEGSVTTSRFTNSTSKCSGLLLEAGRVAVLKSTFDLQKGAGIEGNAASQVLVRGCTFNECAMAITATEAAIVSVQGNTFTKNGVVLVGTGNAPDRGAHFQLYTNEFIENAMDRGLDVNSTIEMKGAMDPAVLRAFGVSEEPVTTTRRRSRK